MEIAQDIIVKEENMTSHRGKKLIEDVPEICGLELVKHVESKAKSSS